MKHKYKIPAVLFAGGNSSRMGEDKALLPFAGYTTLSEYQYRRLETLFENVYISSREEKFDFSARVILDHYEARSPLVGIISIFETLDVDALFILSVDAPFVDETVIEVLMKNREGSDAVIAKTESGRQPLCGIYTRSVLEHAKENLKNNDHRLANLLNKVTTHFVFFKDDTLFLNLNHPHEYEKALLQLKA